VLKHFPTSKLICNQGTFEQDGLILRIMERENKLAAWPQVEKCRHLGWWGYNRQTGIAPTGFFDERVRQVRAVLKDSVKAAAHFGSKMVKRETEPQK